MGGIWGTDRLVQFLQLFFHNCIFFIITACCFFICFQKNIEAKITKCFFLRNYWKWTAVTSCRVIIMRLKKVNFYFQFRVLSYNNKTLFIKLILFSILFLSGMSQNPKFWITKTSKLVSSRFALKTPWVRMILKSIYRIYIGIYLAIFLHTACKVWTKIQ